MRALRVLVVDKESGVLSYASSVLRSAGYLTFTARSPEHALELLSHGFDFVISDVFMPSMRGAELIAEIGRQSPSTVAVLMSRFVPRTAGLGTAGLDGVPLLPKPFTPQALLDKVAQAISGRFR